MKTLFGLLFEWLFKKGFTVYQFWIVNWPILLLIFVFTCIWLILNIHATLCTSVIWITVHHSFNFTTFMYGGCAVVNKWFSNNLMIYLSVSLLYAKLCFFFWSVWFDSLRPIDNLSVIKGRLFLGWTSTKLGLFFLLKDTTQWRRWGSNLRPLRLKASTLPMSHCAPPNCVNCSQSWISPFSTDGRFLSNDLIH